MILATEYPLRFVLFDEEGDADGNGLPGVSIEGPAPALGASLWISRDHPGHTPYRLQEWVVTRIDYRLSQWGDERQPWHYSAQVHVRRAGQTGEESVEAIAAPVPRAEGSEPEEAR